MFMCFVQIIIINLNRIRLRFKHRKFNFIYKYVIQDKSGISLCID